MALTVEAALTQKRFSSPDEVRQYTQGSGKVELLEVGGRMIGRSTCEPGWKWSRNVKPLAQTESCEVFHLGMMLSGEMRIEMSDGQQIILRAGDVCAIPPGHDAEVLGDETCVLIDFGDIAEFAKPAA